MTQDELKAKCKAALIRADDMGRLAAETLALIARVEVLQELFSVCYAGPSDPMSEFDALRWYRSKALTALQDHGKDAHL